MNPQELEQVIRDYIPQIVHMSLATSKDNKPWVCEVHFAYDNELNLYFASSTTTRHAQEIAANPYVAGTIVVQHQDGEKPRGVYFEGMAKVVSGTEMEIIAKETYGARFGEQRLQNFAKDPAVKLFQITVDSYYLFDTRGEHQGKHALLREKMK